MNMDDIAARLEALGHPTRFQIFRTLVRVGETGLVVGQLQQRLDIAASTLSHHLARLMMVGLIEQDRHGTSLICRANFEMMQALVSALADECCVEQHAGLKKARAK